MQHPEQFVEPAGRHEHWDHCFRCNQDFNFPGRPHRGVWCFEGEHTQDIARLNRENWSADPFDLLK
jgi:hypothetical protein